MEICKDAVVKGIGTPGTDELALINCLARRELGADEVYTFALRLCDNDIDRDHERFDDAALDELAPMFVGVSGVFDHQWSAREQTARIYRTEVVGGEGTLTADGRPYRFLKGWAYMMRTDGNAALIAEIDGGIKREVSVGCAVEKVICSICGRELDQCPHEKGEEYEGQVCCGVLTGATDAYECPLWQCPPSERPGSSRAPDGRWRTRPGWAESTSRACGESWFGWPGSPSRMWNTPCWRRRRPSWTRRSCWGSSSCTGKRQISC